MTTTNGPYSLTPDYWEKNVLWDQ